MTRKSQPKTNSAKVSGAVVVASTQSKKKTEVTDNSVAVESRLLSGLKFEVPNGAGGTTTFVIPGVNDMLRGKRHGVLALPGNAVLCRVPADTWAYIKKAYGRCRFFTSLPPLIRELPSASAFSSKTMSEERKEADTKMAPLDPKTMGVTPV